MTDEESEKRKAKRRLDPKRPLEYLIVERGVFEQMLEVTPRQCQDYAGICLYLMSHPLMGDFIPDAADWGKDKCARMLKIHGKIAADCALFRRETRAGNSGIACTLYPLDDAAKALEKRGIRRDAAMARWARGMHADACSNEQTKERGIEEEEEEKDIPLSQGASFHTPPYPPERPADGRMEAPADTAGRNLFKVGNRPASVLKRPKDAGEVEQAARGLLPPEMLDAAPIIARAFFESNEAMGWTDEDGNPVQNWMNRLKGYCKSCVEHGVFSKPDDSQPPPAPTMPVGACPRPTLAEVAEALSKRWPFAGHSQDSLEAYARKFLAWMDGRGWRKKTGEPIKDWKKSCLPVFVQKLLKERSKQ